MKHLAKVLALIMALALAFGLVACGHEHTAGSEWKSDETNHWHTCTECDEVMDEAAHTPGEWQVDAESGEHYRVCTVCGYETDRAAHTAGSELKFNSDYTQQWNECTVCGAEMNKTAHTHTADETEWGSDATNHWRNCSVCGQKVASTEEAHVLGEYKSDETDHWQVCEDCGAVVGKEAHVAGEVKTDGTTDTVKCEDCGYVMSETPHQHRLGAYESDETNHWQTCETCSLKVGEAAHTAGEWTYDAESGKDVQLCSVCDYQMNEREHVHAYTVWTNDGSGDTVSCICGEAYVMPTQKVNLDVQYTNSIVSENQTAQATVDLSAYEGISYTSAKLDDIDVTAQFADGTLTFGVAQFGFLYGEKTLVITVTDADEVTRTINVPVILVTKVFTDKAGFDSMSAIAKECESGDANTYGGYFELGANIPYKAIYTGMMPSNISDQAKGFIGVFDGCGYAIDGIQINEGNNTTASGALYAYNNNHSVFGVVHGATIKNIKFTNAVIEVKGSLIATIGSGLVENIYASFAAIQYNGTAANCRIALAFGQSAQAGATIKDCVVDLSNTSYSGRYGSDTSYELPVFGYWTILEGVYAIGEGPNGYDPFSLWTPNETDVYGLYDTMEDFTAAYKAADSALKAEIDTWDTTYWQVTDGAISFVDKSAA